MERKIGQEIKRTPTNSWLAFFTRNKYSWITIYFKGGREVSEEDKGKVKDAENHYRFIWPILNSIWFTRTKKEVYDVLRKFLKEEKK